MKYPGGVKGYLDGCTLLHLVKQLV